MALFHKHCSLCGNKAGMSQVYIDNGKGACCSDCRKKIQSNGRADILPISYTIDQMKMLLEHPEWSSDDFKKAINPDYIPVSPDGEIYKQCEICGHVFCYTIADLKKNVKNSVNAALSGLAGAAGAVGGAYGASAVNNANANNYANQVVDYNKCPKCNSSKLKQISAEDAAKAQKAPEQPASSVISAADELKKFKELLDLGIITQEEFDSKKKELLGL